MIAVAPSESVGKRHFSVKLCGTLCLCGENYLEKIHHRDTEVTQRTTETGFSDRLLKGDSSFRDCEIDP